MNHVSPQDCQHPDHQPDPADHLQRQIHVVTTETLRAMLPPLREATPEAIAARDHAAIATVAALVPGNPAEARLAALHVATGAHATDCLIQIVHYDADPKRVAGLRAQAASMGRESRGYLGLLLRLQAVRVKREANDTARDSAAWTEHATLGLMTDVLDKLPPPRAPAPAPTEAKAPAPAAEAEASARPRLLDYDEWPEEMKQRDRLRAKADRYAILNTMRVKLIRKLGGLPPDCDFEPPEPEVLHAIIHGDTSNLRWADSYEPWVSATE